MGAWTHRESVEADARERQRRRELLVYAASVMNTPSSFTSAQVAQADGLAEAAIAAALTTGTGS